MRLLGFLAMLCLFLASAGCARHSMTRVFLHGEVMDENAKLIADAVVRFGDVETVSDAKGHYRFLFLTQCMRSGVGSSGISNEVLETYAPGFHLDSVELIGFAGCPADTDKYLRVTLVPVAAP